MAVRPSFTSGEVFTAANANILASSIVALNTQAGTAYTAALTDVGKLVEFTSASAIIFTIPANATVAFAIGDQINVYQDGAGQVTIAGDSGVTVNATPGLKLRTQYSSATLFKRAENTWVVFGDLTA